MGCQGQCATGLQVSLTHALIAYHHTWFWSSEKITFSTVWKHLWDQRTTASSSTLQLAWSKAALSAHVCLVQYWNGQCRSSGRNATVLATTFGTEEFLIGVPACCAQSYEEIGQVLDMLVDALGQVGFVLNGAKYFLRRRANIQQYFHLQAW